MTLFGVDGRDPSGGRALPPQVPPRMSSLLTSDFVKGVAAGAAIGALATAIIWRSSSGPSAGDSTSKPAGSVIPAGAVSTTNSGTVPAASGGSGNVYETSTAVSEYLMFHYGDPKDVLPYPGGPHEALQFGQRYINH